MKNSQIKLLLDFANMQMAAEAFLLQEGDLGDIAKVDAQLVNRLQRGNTHASHFTKVQAEKFSTEFTVLAQYRNDGLQKGGYGFGGTLFQNRNTKELTLSFRSTEFLDDNLRDNKSTNELEVKEIGWALGQITEMEAWYRQLRDSPTLLGGKRFNVTGYSLGGHLATAFNILRRGEGQAQIQNPVISTYTFNGAGVGGVKGNKTLADVLNRFAEGLVAADAGEANALGLSDPRVIAQFEQIRNLLFAGDERTDAISRKKLRDATFGLRANPNPGVPGSFPIPLSVDAKNLLEAIERLERILDEKSRVDRLGGIAFADSASPPVGLQASVGYQLASMRAADMTIPASVPGDLANPIVLFGLSTNTGVNNFPKEKKYPAIPTDRFVNMVEINGFDGGKGGASFVSFSGLHYGNDLPIYIEDQPLFRGSILTDMINFKSLASPNLLVSDAGKNDFGDTHSLVLLIDSLSLMAVIESLDPTFTLDIATEVFRAAGNSKAVSLPFSQGEAEGDTLERVLDTMRELFLGSGQIPTANYKLTLAGNTWHADELRKPYHENLQALQARVEALKAESGTTYRVVSLVNRSPTELSRLAKEDSEDGIAYRYAMKSLNPFAVLGYNYGIHNADGALDLYDEDVDDGITEKWIEDRANLLAASLKYNTNNRQDKIVAGSIGYFDGSKKIDGQPLAFRGDASPTMGVAFASIEGGELKANLQSPPSIHVFGGSGDDVLKFLSTTNTYLEGGRGNDAIASGGAKDEIWGGYGDDTIDTGSGDDTIYGGDGDDVIKGGEGDDLIYGDGKDPANLLITGDDEIDGGAGDDEIYASDGDNIIDGGAGDDMISAGDDDNLIEGGEGQDHIEAGDGANTVHGGTGDDEIEVGDGDNTVYGDEGDDTITVGDGFNLVVGGAGDDTIVLGDGGGVAWGDLEDGDDALVGGADSIVAGSGADQLHGGGGADDLAAGEGDDLLVGGYGVGDYLIGGTGNDAYRIKSRHGNDVILDEDGIGAVSFDDSALSGGKNRGPGGIEWFDDPDNPTYRYTSEGPVSRRGAGASVALTVSNLKTGSAVFIDEFYNGDLGIELDDGKKKPPLPGMAEPSRPATPARLLKRYRGLIIAFVAVSLTGCGKSIAFLEEADVTGYAKTPVTLERKQFYEKRNNQLRWIDVFVRAEMRILDTQLPTWRGELHPVFLGHQKELGFVLVTSIRDSITCVKRGRPNSSYVAFVVSGQQWIETEVPFQFDKARSNLLLAPSLGADYSVEKPLTMMDKEFSNRQYGLGAGLDVIDLGKPYGC